MKPINLVFTIVIFFFLFGCRDSNKTMTDGPIVFDLAGSVNDNGTALASDFFSDVELVVLDGKKQFYFPRHIISSRHYKNYSLFYDYGESFLGVFSHEGDFLLSLDKQGRGPGEYTVVIDCGMDHEETKIYVAEGFNKKIHWYDLKGNWLETINIPTKFNNVFVLPDGNYLFQNERYEPDQLDSSRLFLCNPKGELIKSVWNKSTEISDFPQFMDRNWIKETKGHGLIYRDSPMYDTVYQINEEYKISPFFIIDPGKLRLPEDLASDTRRSDEWGKYLRAHYYFFSGNNIIISASHNKKWIPFLASIKSGELTGLSEIKNDLIGWISIPFIETMDGQYLVQEISAQYYKEHIDEAIIHEDVKFPELQKKLRETLENAGEELDMILLYYKLK